MLNGVEEEEDPFSVFSEAPKMASPEAQGERESGTTETTGFRETTGVDAGISVIATAANNNDGHATRKDIGESVEPRSGIRIKSTTSAFSQLAVHLAESPFLSFSNALQKSTGGAAVEHTVIGVVVRKSDPKKNSKGGSNSVAVLWNMNGPSPSKHTEISFLLCGNEFDRLHSQLFVGGVFAVSNFKTMPNSGREKSGSPLMFVNKTDQVKFLGYAADLGTCEATSRASGEKCARLVNKKVSLQCDYHISNLKSLARGKLPPSSGGKQKTLAPVSRHQKVFGLETPKQVPFLTVRGGVLQHAKETSGQMQGMGYYAGVNKNSALPINSKIDTSHLDRLPSSKQLGVSGKGRAVLQAAVDHDVKEEHKVFLKELESARVMSDSASKRPRNSSDRALADNVKAKYAPIVNNKETVFAPLKRFCADGGVAVDPNAGNASGRFQPSGNNSLLLSAVKRTMKSSNSRTVTASDQTSLKDIAKGINSRNTDLLVVQERDETAAKLDKLIVQENAIAVLSKITAQKIAAVFCTDCKQYYAGACPDSCKINGHRTQRVTTLKRYIECHQCGFKTFVLGEHVHPSTVHPKCPRCDTANAWVLGNASPELRAPQHEQ
ncbi:Primase zinc finger/Mcm10 replication factor, putative [Angomonas deanei]|uniref:Primase zinc finger/Mcm10 replication factor, putative n=1 Tax=Angomonas deanei TaxID=59799 RepID=A0A7G2CIE9_9TRYP|nr:Primase zinc finger/Mcm10 replication factor, putative [Angomonas deanei]